jgi:hypothetical protein
LSQQLRRGRADIARGDHRQSKVGAQRPAHKPEIPDDINLRHEVFHEVARAQVNRMQAVDGG